MFGEAVWSYNTFRVPENTRQQRNAGVTAQDISLILRQKDLKECHFPDQEKPSGCPVW